MGMAQGGKRLKADDWARAALDALADGGIGGVSVEPLARRLGTSKGSFYWHFKNRDSLIQAAMELWEKVGTDEVIAELEDDKAASPRDKLRALLSRVLSFGMASRIETSLLASADHPLVGPVLERIGRKRIGYVAAQFEEMGMAGESARSKAVLMVSAYYGVSHVNRTTPGALPGDDEKKDEFVELALRSLLD
ncbi:TetR/AcrR family transcriptional regulator [Salininema proteolyticum]|uniref:TetR/AcrR family transcriptional regulator n=1 Tax=Salininema proteolyticum TaxID=1607685 RepID=A0ABV8TUD2_9ACTN